jgi:putative NIF3 family GTP cyclohydrolase 1 type 2
VLPDSVADGIRFGDKDTPVIKVGPGWIDSVDNLAAAAADGCNVFISHEIPFSWEARGSRENHPWYKKRMQVLEESGMVLMNLHDTWDHFPEIGVRDAFAKLLGLTELVEELDYIHPFADKVTTGHNSLGIYRVAPTTAEEFAKYMCGRVAQVKAPGLLLNGDGSLFVDKVAIGVGCHVPSLEAARAGAQVLVDVYDRHFQQQSRIPLSESDVAVITVEHSVAETYSMKLMADHIRDVLGIEAVYYNNEPVGKYFIPEQK